MLETSTLHALTSFAEDLTAATTFYGDALGLTEGYQDDNSVVFALGPTMVDVLSVHAAPTLLAPAAPGPVDRPWGVRTASSTDPAGHVWEVAHSIAG